MKKKLLSNVGSFSVYQVDGEKIRRDIEPDFTNFSQHYRFNFIPKKEFWIDKQVDPKEISFFILHMLEEYYLMENGMSYKKALEQADELEQRERNKSLESTKRGDAFVKSQYRRKQQQVKKEFYKEINGIKVYIVDGNLVRSAFYIDFVAGGHDKVYGWIPTQEIWLEKGDTSFMYYTLLHEAIERELMDKMKMSYDEAHKQALEAELIARQSDK